MHSTRANTCSSCKNLLPENARFCSYCGAMQKGENSAQDSKYTYSTQYPQSDESGAAQKHTQSREIYKNKLSELMPYIGKNSEYYLPIFMNFYMKNRKIHWNWSAFFFPFAWFAYRKMYALSFISTFIYFVTALLPSIYFLLLCLMILSGLFANYLYFEKIEQRVSESQGLSPEMKKEHLKKYGGDSETASILFMGGFCMVTLTSLAILAVYQLIY